MTSPQTDAAARLEADRHDTTARLADLRRDFGAMVAASLDSNADDEHDPEGATIAYERSQLDALIHQAERHLADLTAAQTRLDEGTYGVCTVCGKAIDPARLEARPVARTCVTCA